MSKARKRWTFAAAFVLGVCMLLAPALSGTVTAYGAEGSLSGAGTQEEPYLIEDAADLAKMAADVNAGTGREACYALAADIDLSSVCGPDLDGGTSWTPIGTSANRFQGIFDGKGHKITGLYINAAEGHQALFGYARGASIGNFILQGEVTSTSGVDNAGVIGEATTPVTLEYIGNEVNVTAQSNSTGGLIGVISYGTGSNTVKSCFNRGSITSSGNDVGGLIGYVSYDPILIEDCYNAGDVSSTTSNRPKAAGLLSTSNYADVTIRNAFSCGTITAATNDPIISSRSGGSLTEENTYYLEGTGTCGTDAQAKSAAELRTLASALGEAWQQGDLYPILNFEYVPGKASIAGPEPAQQEVQQGAAAQEISVAVTGDSRLDPSAYTLTCQWYQASDSDLSDAAAIEGAVSDKYLPKIPQDMETGDYYYYCVVTSTSADGSFETVETASAPARVDVTSAAEAAVPSVTVTKDIEGDSVEQGSTINFTAEGNVSGTGAGTLSYEWFRASGETPDPANDERIGTGETCEFTASDLGEVIIYCVATNTFENVKKAQKVSDPVRITVKGKTISTAEELAEFAEAVNAGDSFKGKTIALEADIDLSGSGSWTPIGNTTGRAFQGTFDGKGHSITGMNIESTGDYQGLFGVVKDAVIRNLTVSGSVTGRQYTAGVVGQISYATYNQGKTLIENVGNEVDVTVTGTSSWVGVTGGGNSGGIAGYVGFGAGAEIRGCYNSGTITGNNKCLGGILGYSASASAVKIISCYNTGEIVSNADKVGNTNAGGICGSAATLDNCYNAGLLSHPAYEGEDAYTYALVGITSAPACESPCYWLEGTAAAAAGTDSELAVKKTNAEMVEPAFAALLGEQFKAQCGCPVLKWQEAKEHEIDVAYGWAPDHRTVTGYSTCLQCGALLEEETAEADYEVAKKPSSTEDGTGVYTAQFESGTFETQKYEEPIPILTEEEVAARDEALEKLTDRIVEANRMLAAGSYTENSRDALQQAVDEANLLYDDDTTTEADVAAARAKLIGAMRTIVPADPSLSNIEKELNNAYDDLTETLIDIYGNVDLSRYKADSVKALQEQIDAAEALLESEDGAELNDLRDRRSLLLKAWKDLQKKDTQPLKATASTASTTYTVMTGAAKTWDLVKASGNKGKLSFSLAAGSTPGISVNAANGRITLKKGASAGTYTANVKVTAAATDNCFAAAKTVKASVRVAKVAQKMKASVKTKKVKAKKAKKKAQKVSGAIKVKNAKGKVTYRKMGGSARLKVSAKNGKITVKKGTKKGTYKVKVRVRAAGDRNYNAAVKMVTVKIRVK